MAEGLFLKAVADRGDYEVSSAGVAASKGTPASRETDVVLKKRGAELESFVSRPVSEAILSKATHVFAMTRGHLQVLEARFPKHADKFYLTCEFTDTSKKGVDMDVPDPIGMSKAAYEEVANILEAAIPTIVAYIDKTWKKPE